MAVREYLFYEKEKDGLYKQTLKYPGNKCCMYDKCTEYKEVLVCCELIYFLDLRDQIPSNHSSSVLNGKTCNVTWDLVLLQAFIPSFYTRAFCLIRLEKYFT